MSLPTFRQLLDGLIRAAIESGISSADVHGELAVASMGLDDNRVEEPVEEEAAPY